MAEGGAARKAETAKPAATIRLAGINAFASLQRQLDRRRITVGSSSENDLVLAHSSVSRRHAVIRRQFGRYAIKDLGSTNGTFVNGERIAKVRVIKPGDEVRFGAARFAVLGRKPQRHYLRRIVALAILIVAFAAGGFFAVRFAIAPKTTERAASSPSPQPAQTARARATAIPAASSSAKPATVEAKATPRPAVTAPPPAKVERAPVTVPPPRPPAPAVAAARPAPIKPPPATGPSPAWLARVNYFRTAAGLPALAEDPALSDGDRKHAVYLVKNYGDRLRSGGHLGADAHSEDNSMPYYSAAGDRAAHSSDESEEYATVLADPQTWAIDNLMAVPFHRLFILNPLLKTVGYGQDCENHVCVAMLNVLSGAGSLPMGGAPLAHAIEFPADGMAIPSKMNRMMGEWPSPLTSCDGYSFPTGIPATVQLGPMVDAQLGAFSISRDGEKVESCGIDASSYRNPNPDERKRVVQVLHAQGAIAIVPKRPLTPGAHYQVSATVNGREYQWSFSVEP